MPIGMKTILHPINTSFIIANILFFEAVVMPYLEGSTKFPILVHIVL